LSININLFAYSSFGEFASILT